MGWTQEYYKPSLVDLVRKISQDAEVNEKYIPSEETIINYYLDKTRGVHISEIREIKLDEDMFQDIIGKEVELSNGDIYRMTLVDKYVDQESGNYGCDIYGWKRLKK
jgi:hypothetical protein